jgi:hypothetical protein
MQRQSNRDNVLDSSRKAYAELMSTRTRQLDKQVERVYAPRATAGLNQLDEFDSSSEALGIAVGGPPEDD